MFDSAVRSTSAAPAPSEVDDGELVELIQAWERLASWAAAGQLAAIAELARRRPRDLLERPGGQGDAGHPGVPEVSEFAVDEVAAALRLSRPAAGARLHSAVELTRLPRTAAALHDGVLDVPRCAQSSMPSRRSRTPPRWPWSSGCCHERRGRRWGSCAARSPTPCSQPILPPRSSGTSKRSPAVR